MRVISFDSTNTIISVKNVGDDYSLQIREIASATGEMGQIMQSDGNFIDSPGYDPSSLMSAQQYKITQINATADEKINNGYYSYAEGATNADNTVKALLYKSDISHQLDMLGELTQAQTGNECTWKDASIIGSCHVVTAAVVQQLYKEMVDHIKWCKTTADKLCGEVMAATTVDAVNAITFPDEPAPTAPVAS